MDLQKLGTYTDITLLTKYCSFLTCRRESTNVATIGRGKNKIVLSAYCPLHAFVIKRWLKNPDAVY